MLHPRKRTVRTGPRYRVRVRADQETTEAIDVVRESGAPRMRQEGVRAAALGPSPYGPQSVFRAA
jgi:hypothetical protein